MADKSSSVRMLQQHLRQAGERLGAGDLEGAAGHVDAALAVDPSSLAALALRDRIFRMRSTSADAARRPRPAGESGLSPGSAVAAPRGRFVPKGVDPQSWMSFEGRIEERRFRSLLRSAREAVDRGDAVVARIAVEEARELRPDAPEVAEVSEAVAALPVPAPVAEGGFLQSRTFRAAATLVVGVALMLGLDWMRADAPDPDILALERGAAPADQDIFASVSRGQTDATALERLPQPAEGRQAQTRPSAEPISTPPSSTPSVAAVPPDAVEPPAVVRPDERVAAPTIDLEPPRAQTPVREIPDDFVAAPVTAPAIVTSRAASAPDGRAARPAGEIPDDYVAPPPVTARSTVTAPTPAVPAATASGGANGGAGASSSLPLGNVRRESPPAGSLATPRGATAADTTSSGRDASPAPAAAPPSERPAAAVSTATAVVPRDPRSEVMTVVQSYTRALERFDTRAAREIWPTVNERALSRSLNDVESQTFTFSSPCDIDVQGPRATASCRGSVQYVVKVGNREPITEPRRWDIRLSRSGDTWFIDSVQVAAR